MKFLGLIWHKKEWDSHRIWLSYITGHISWIRFLVKTTKTCRPTAYSSTFQTLSCFIKFTPSSNIQSWNSLVLFRTQKYVLKLYNPFFSSFIIIYTAILWHTHYHMYTAFNWWWFMPPTAAVKSVMTSVLALLFSFLA